LSAEGEVPRAVGIPRGRGLAGRRQRGSIPPATRAGIALGAALLAVPAPAPPAFGHGPGPGDAAHASPPGRAELDPATAGARHRAPARAGSPDRPGPLFEPPEPGSYALPVIQRLVPHPVLDADSRPTWLPDLRSGRIAVVSFVYTACPDARGCPLAFATLDALDELIAGDPALAPRVELASVSFDPARDTPHRMRRLRDALAPKSRWRFLTPAAEADLGPLLRDFGQDALRLTRETGEASPVIRHVLKLFLLDARGRVRNVYSAGLLDPRLILADLRTLLREQPKAAAR